MTGHLRAQFVSAMFGLLFFSAGITADSARSEEPPAQGTLSGTIVDADGKPVAGARVKLMHFDASKSETFELTVQTETTSGAAGRFQLGPLDAEYRCLYDLRIEADGFAAAYVNGDSVSIVPGIDNSLGTIHLEPGYVLRGVVLDEDDGPRVGAVVHCRAYRHELGHTVSDITPEYTLTTDSQGRYETPRLPTGQYSVSTQPPERQIAFLIGALGPDTPTTLEPMRLKKDVPVRGTLVDELGRPLGGVRVTANSVHTDVTDLEGRFVLRGFGETGHCQMQIRKDGYVFINWAVDIKPEGMRWSEVGPEDRKSSELVKELTVVMKRQAWIEGRIVDDATGEPVKIDRVVLCFFERKPNGEIVLGGCRASKFEQPKTGTFRVAYSVADEYHLTISAEGYHDGEAFTRNVSLLEPIDGIEVRLKSKSVDAKPQIATRRISGTVTRNGVPVKNGWVALRGMRRQTDIVNAYILRGRTTTGDTWAADSAPIRDGQYSLEAPYQNPFWVVTVEEPGQPPTLIWPVPIGANEDKHLDIACVAGGGIRGRVTNVPPQWRGKLWVVAFSSNGIRQDVRVADDGSFAVQQLPPGRYGLKVGSDALLDSEVPRPKDWKDIAADAWKTKSDPWPRAKIATFKAGETVEGVELEYVEK